MANQIQSKAPSPAELDGLMENNLVATFNEAFESGPPETIHNLKKLLKTLE